MVLVGNRCDLEEERQVSALEGQSLSESLGCPFYETSSKTGINVKEAFFELVREIQKDNPARIKSGSDTTARSKRDCSAQ